MHNTGAFWMNAEQRIKFVCKHCKVQVVSRMNYRAILGREHKKSCPRFTRPSKY